MSPRPDRRPDARPDRGSRRPGGAPGNRPGPRPGSRPPRFAASRRRDLPESGGYGRSGEDRGEEGRAERPGDGRGSFNRGGDVRARFGSERRPFEGRPGDRRPFDSRRPERPDADRRDRRDPERRDFDRREGERGDGPRADGSRADGSRRPGLRFGSDRRGDRLGPDRRGGARPAGAPRFRDNTQRPRPAFADRASFAPTAAASPGRGAEAAEGRSDADAYAAAAPSDLIWGRHAALAALESGRPVHRIWCTPEMRFSPRFLQLLREAKASGVLVEEVTWARLGQLTGGAVHQGIVLQPAAAETLDLPSLIDGCRGLGESPLLIAVDGLTDPQNLGAIVRSAEALGAHGMVLPQRRNAGLTGSVAKVAAGALEHLPVARVVNLNRALDSLKQEGYRVVGLAAEGNVSLEEVDLEGPLVLVTGSEGDGLSMLTRRNCDQLVRIPLRGATPSLNASVATALLLYEVARRGWMRGLAGSAPAPRLVRPCLPTAAPVPPSDLALEPEEGPAEPPWAEQADQTDHPGPAPGDAPSPQGSFPSDSWQQSSPQEAPADRPSAAEDAAAETEPTDAEPTGAESSDLDALEEPAGAARPVVMAESLPTHPSAEQAPPPEALPDGVPPVSAAPTVILSGPAPLTGGTVPANFDADIRL